MNFIWGLIAFVVMLSVIVVIHEYGHYLAARAFGVHVHEFSLGMGPLLWKKQGKQTQWSLRAIPFGGYCMMAGETSQSAEEEEEDKPDWQKDLRPDELLNNKKPWQQIIVLLAGVAMNFLLASLIYVGISLSQGVMPVAQAEVGDVIAGTPAERAGLQAGDKLTKVTDGRHNQVIEDQYDLTEFINLYPGTVTLTVDRDGQMLEVEITPEMNEEAQVYQLGIHTPVTYVQVPWYKSVQLGFENMWDTVVLMFRSLGQLFTGSGYENLSGPIGILDVTAQQVQLGWLPYLNLIALVSLNVGIFNLLPIPALDGGRVLLVVLEKLLGRKINPKIVENILMASFVLLFGLMIYASFNDIMRMIG